jgi:rhamnogalacturonyl hydrolase YesR
MKNFNYCLAVCFIQFLILCLININAQTVSNKSVTSNSLSGQDQYYSPFKIPSPDSIKNIIDRVGNYFISETPFRIINKKNKIEITDFSQPVEDADLDNGDHNLFLLWKYEMGVTYTGLLKASDVTGNKKYSDYVLKCFKFFFDKLPYFQKIDSIYGDKNNSYRQILHTSSLDDCGAMGSALIRIYKIDKDPRYIKVIKGFADYISNKQFRLKDGTLARQGPQAKSVWADDTYMSIPFLTQIGSLTGKKKYFDDAVRQVLLFSKYLFKKDKRLFDHGLNIDNKYDPSIYWARANGWVILAINELLDVLPENYKNRNNVINILRMHVQGLTECQGGNGLWHNLLDRNDSFEETSASAMFVYCIAHSINNGWVNKTFAPVAQVGWDAIAKKINNKGQVEGTCVGTAMVDVPSYYYQREVSKYAAHGYGPVLLAASEMIKLIENNFLVNETSMRK